MIKGIPLSLISFFKIERPIVFAAQPLPNLIKCIPVVFWYQLLNASIISLICSAYPLKALPVGPAGAEVYDYRCNPILLIPRHLIKEVYCSTRREG